ncbi:MAG: MATE family efflux transporter [Ketobacteraceae bacterium]|nr:MATE family efflux transporter [Ketobacteraceae bacterium]
MTKNKEQDYTGASRVISNVLTGWISYLILFVVGFFLPRFIDEKLGQELLGIWDFSWSVANYFSLASLGIGSSLNRFVAKYRAEQKLDQLSIAVTSVVWVQAGLALLVSMAALAGSYLLPYYFGDRFGENTEAAQAVVLYLGLSIALQFLFDTSRGILTGCHRWDLFNGLNSLAYMLTVILMIGALSIGGSLQQMSIIYMLMTGVQGAVRMYLARRICPEARFSPRFFSFEFVKEIFPFGVKTIMIGISHFLIVQSSYLLVASTLGPAALAVLARPVSLVKHVESFITRFAFILTPMAGSMQASQDQTRLNSFVYAASKYGFAFTLPAMILFGFYGNDLLRVWMGGDYVTDYLVLILAIGLLLPISQSPVVRIMVGRNLHGPVALMSLLMTVAGFAVGASVALLYGVTVETAGVLIVTLSTLVNGIAVPIYSCIRMGVPVMSYIRETFLRVALIGAASLAVLFVFDSFVHFHGALIFLNVAVYGIFTLVLYWFFLLTEKDKQTVLKKLPARFRPG